MSALAQSKWTSDGTREVTSAGAPTIRSAYLLAALCVVCGFAVWHASLVSRALSRAPHNDFGRFYLSTRAHVEGGDIYAWNEAIPARLPSLVDLKVHEVDLWNMNPPHFHLLILPLVHLAPWAALAVWIAVGVVALAVSLRLISRELKLATHPEAGHVLAIALLAGVATAVTLVTGQVSWILMLLVTLAWIQTRRDNWWQAGAWLGIAIGWKPFLLIVLPWFVLQRRWRALAAIAGTASLSFVIGLAVFGIDSHLSWMRCIGEAENWAWLHVNASLWGFLSRAATANPLFVPITESSTAALKAIWFLVAGCIGAVTVAVAITDRSTIRLDRAFATHLTASFLICPLGWNYYWFLALGPVLSVLLASKAFNHDAGNGRATQWERLLFLFGSWGWFAPAYVTQIVPGALMTVTIGSVYFWSTLCVWAALVVGAWPHVVLPGRWRDLIVNANAPAETVHDPVCANA